MLNNCLSKIRRKLKEIHGLQSEIAFLFFEKYCHVRTLEEIIGKFEF